MVDSNRSELNLSNETIRISFSVISYDEKTVKNECNGYDVKKHIISKLSKISIPNWKKNFFIWKLYIFINTS